MWDELVPSIATVTHLTVNGAGLTIPDGAADDGNPFDVTLTPTWSPRVGTQLKLPRFELRPAWGEWEIAVCGGVGYEPTPLVSQSSATALLDGNRTIFALGLGLSTMILSDGRKTRAAYASTASSSTTCSSRAPWTEARRKRPRQVTRAMARRSPSAGIFWRLAYNGVLSTEWAAP